MFVDLGIGAIALRSPSAGRAMFNSALSSLNSLQTKANVELLTELELTSIGYYKH